MTSLDERKFYRAYQCKGTGIHCYALYLSEIKLITITLYLQHKSFPSMSSVTTPRLNSLLEDNVRPFNSYIFNCILTSYPKCRICPMLQQASHSTCTQVISSNVQSCSKIKVTASGIYICNETPQVY